MDKVSAERLRYIAFAQKVCGDDLPTLGETVDMARELLALRSQQESPSEDAPLWLRLGKLSIAERPDGETYVLESEALAAIQARGQK